MTSWETNIPPTAGILPGGKPLARTDPAGKAPAAVAFLGVYPALTRQRQFTVAGTRMNLPVEVEHQSFAPDSASGEEFGRHYLEQLSLTRDATFVFDLAPYYLANISVNRSSGRSMADNVRLYENDTGTATGINPRPKGEDFLRLVRQMPGNLERLAHYLTICRPTLLFTLGTEPAAFVRNLSFRKAEAQVDTLFYNPPVQAEIEGINVQVVHLVHPHPLMKRNAKWTGRHTAWCRDHGRALVEGIVPSRRQEA